MNRSFVSIAAGENHSLAIDSDGHLYALGDNSFGQLGFGSGRNASYPQRVGDNNFPLIVAIATSANHNLAIAEDGGLYAWGANHYGQLGLGHRRIAFYPQRVGGDGFPLIVAVSAGVDSSLAVDEEGNL